MSILLAPKSYHVLALQVLPAGTWWTREAASREQTVPRHVLPCHLLVFILSTHSPRLFPTSWKQPPVNTSHSDGVAVQTTQIERLRSSLISQQGNVLCPKFYGEVLSVAKESPGQAGRWHVAAVAAVAAAHLLQDVFLLWTHKLQGHVFNPTASLGIIPLPYRLMNNWGGAESEFPEASCDKQCESRSKSLKGASYRETYVGFISKNVSRFSDNIFSPSPSLSLSITSQTIYLTIYLSIYLPLSHPNLSYTPIHTRYKKELIHSGTFRGESFTR